LFVEHEKPVIFVGQSKVSGIGDVDFFDGYGSYEGGVEAGR
jgi:hypothetical protein